MPQEIPVILTSTHHVRTKILRRQFETNVFGVLDVTNATLPYLRESRGILVVIGSRSAWKPELPVSTDFLYSSDAIDLSNNPHLRDLVMNCAMLSCIH